MSDQDKTRIGHTNESGAHARPKAPTAQPVAAAVGTGVHSNGNGASPTDQTGINNGAPKAHPTLTGMTAPRPKSASVNPADATVVLGPSGPSPVPNGSPPTVNPNSMAQGTPIPGAVANPGAATNIAQPRAKRPSVAPS